MKIKLFIMMILVLTFVFAQTNCVKIKVTNNLGIDRNDELVVVGINKIKKTFKEFDETSFIVSDNTINIPYQVNLITKEIYMLVQLKAGESKTLELKNCKPEEKVSFPAKVYAELSMKKNLNHDGKKFRGTEFTNVTELKVPKIHTDHDALFRYEGPGWESELVGYRFYLDWRNATDIFGKTKNGLFLSRTGIHDTVATNDSYHTMQDWGMDIYKVGSALGIGGLGIMEKDSLYHISKMDSTICNIYGEGPLKAEVITKYYGWTFANKKLDLVSNYSINAGSHLTEHKVGLNKDEVLVTGITKNKDAELFKSETNKKWNYIALFGKQSLNNDNLGVVIFYHKNSLVKTGEDKVNHLVFLRSKNKSLNYYFGAFWEKEPGGVKTKEEFKAVIDRYLSELNNPVEAVIKGK